MRKGDACSNCSRLKAENTRLKLHVQKLENEILKLKGQIAHLINLLYKIINYCKRVKGSSVVLRHKGGLKPKEFHRLGGIIEMADAVKARLKRARI